MHASVEATHVASCLVIDRDALVVQWERRVLADKSIPTARTLDLHHLRDYVPKIIDAISEYLRGRGGSVRLLALVHLHADLRRDEGYSLAEALAELAHLYDVLRVRADPQQSLCGCIIANAFEQSFSTLREAFSVGT